MQAPGPSTMSADVFPPTLREVMLRPRWLGMLLLCLVIAGVFAWLGQWQLGRAVDLNPPVAGATEQVRPLADVQEPSEYIPDPTIGQRVTTSGRWIPGDFIVVSSRFNDGVEGFWVAGQLRLGAPAATSLAVAVGWTPDRATADAAAASLNAETADADALRDADAVVVTGRLIADEGPAIPARGAAATELTRMSSAMLLGRWHDVADLDVYRGYVTAAAPLAGLDAIASPSPAERGAVNWLNIFYAAEWTVFAGFAFYLWYRLAKDAWEKELEDLEDPAD